MQMKIPLKNYHKNFCQKKHQIIQINLVLKNLLLLLTGSYKVQIIQINLVLKNLLLIKELPEKGSNNTNKLSPQELFTDSTVIARVQIIQINLVLKNSSPIPL